MSGSQDAQDDGLLQRFIPCLIPDSKASKVGRGRPDYLSYKHQWEQVVRAAYSATKGGNAYMYSPEAEREFLVYEHYLEDLKAEERLIQSNENLRAALGKMLGQTARIAFIWHLIENPTSPIVDHMLVRRAITWSKEYLIPALRYFYSMGDKIETIEKWTTEYLICEEKREVLSVSDLQRAGRRPLERLKLSGFQAREAIESALWQLEQAKWVMPLPMQPGERSQRYAINPQVAIQFAERKRTVAKIKQARIEAVREVSRRASGREAMPRYARGLERSA
jgi:hypothetical protein